MFCVLAAESFVSVIINKRKMYTNKMTIRYLIFFSFKCAFKITFFKNKKKQEKKLKVYEILV